MLILLGQISIRTVCNAQPCYLQCQRQTTDVRDTPVGTRGKGNCITRNLVGFPCNLYDLCFHFPLKFKKKCLIWLMAYGRVVKGLGYKNLGEDSSTFLQLSYSSMDSPTLGNGLTTELQITFTKKQISPSRNYPHFFSAIARPFQTALNPLNSIMSEASCCSRRESMSRAHDTVNRRTNTAIVQSC